MAERHASPAPASSTPAPARVSATAIEAASESAALERRRVRARPRPTSTSRVSSAGLRLHLAHEQRLRLGAGAPVDEARVVARPVGAEVVEIVAAAAAARGRRAPLPPSRRSVSAEIGRTAGNTITSRSSATRPAFTKSPKGKRVVMRTPASRWRPRRGSVSSQVSETLEPGLDPAARR